MWSNKFKWRIYCNIAGYESLNSAQGDPKVQIEQAYQPAKKT